MAKKIKKVAKSAVKSVFNPAKTLKKLGKKIGAKLKGSVDTPDMPEVEEVQEMPVADEAGLAAARRRLAASKRSGRASTMLTGRGAGRRAARRGGRALNADKSRIRTVANAGNPSRKVAGRGPMAAIKARVRGEAVPSHKSRIRTTLGG